MSEILDFFADNPEVTQAIAKSVPMIMGMHQANKAKNDMEDYQIALDNIEKNRQQVVNPYANVTNPFANMQVATKAAQMQAEQTDMALANTLDTLRETGAGGATALAQAALRSKQGISADIQRQEAQNQRLYAQGQQQMEVAKAKGQAFAFQAQEMRDVRDINRLQQNIDITQQQRAAGASTAALSAASAIAGLSGLIEPEVKDTNIGTDTGFLPGYDPAQARSAIGRYGSDGLGDISLALDQELSSYDPTAYAMTQEFFADPNSSTQWGQLGLSNMVLERDRLRQANQSTEDIQALIDSTKKLIK
tara:strand:+ start:119 stop:1036 length:918 start_codon:yes stop_codon:yes gene_type:complete